MIISKSIIEQLAEEIASVPPETGGIFGSKDGHIIDEVIFDKSVQAFNCCYEPDIEYFNACIELWMTSGIEFKGLFHTHFASVKTLSDSDKSYITEIMSAMPSDVKKLYFPVYVLPDRELICYLAERQNDECLITVDELTIIN